MLTVSVAMEPDVKDAEAACGVIDTWQSGCYYRCPSCGQCIRIFGWVREYPIVAFDSKEVNIELVD